jgi:hypothetical protein
MAKEIPVRREKLVRVAQYLTDAGMPDNPIVKISRLSEIGDTQVAAKVEAATRLAKTLTIAMDREVELSDEIKTLWTEATAKYPMATILMDEVYRLNSYMTEKLVHYVMLVDDDTRRRTRGEAEIHHNQ